MSDTEPIVRVQNLKKYFYENDSLLNRLRPDKEPKQVRAVDDVSLQVDQGKTVGLVGESGCGKSTLAETILRLTDPTEGSVYYKGEDITTYDRRQLRQFRKEAQIIFQDPFSSLNPRYKVRRMLMEPMKLHDIGDSREDRLERAAELIVRVGLNEDHLNRYPHEFSGGQRQRIAIARALSVEPQLLVADEPVSALDVSVQRQILNLLRELRDEFGLTMIFISHDLSVIRQICDEVAVMYLGKIVELAETAELFHHPKHPYSEVLISSIPIPDPTVERDTTKLEGDVPSSIDPPHGCRFHPRCPKVIPSADWDGSQNAWQRVIRFKNRFNEGDVNPKKMRKQLETQREKVTDDDVVEELYHEHIVEGGITEDDSVSIPEPARETIIQALSLHAAGDRDRAQTVLEDAFSTVCEKPPRRVAVDGHQTICHLHDDRILNDENVPKPKSS